MIFVSKLHEGVGGYFELELPSYRNIKHEGALKYQSARAAFLDLLRHIKPKRIWMPYYICDSMLNVIRICNIEICFYKIDSNLNIGDNILLKNNDLLLYVNYFGVCLEQVKNVLRKFNPNQVVIDFSQAFYENKQNCLATIYSPRKFFGLPDGGLIFSKKITREPNLRDTNSEERMLHLIKRLSNSPESGYLDYKKSENSLSDVEPKLISRLTEKLLESINYEKARIKRNKNFHFLHKNLKSFNNFPIPSEINSPLCYPLLLESNELKEKLLSKKVFTATYWTDVFARVDLNYFEYNLSRNLIPIPCDQRYNKSDMDYISKLITSNE